MLDYIYIKIESIESLAPYIESITGAYYSNIHFKEKYKVLLEDLFKLQFYDSPSASIDSDTDKTPVYLRIEGYSISSLYWYGSDEYGDYVIRYSDHWDFVGSCQWEFQEERTNEWMAGKCYLKNFEVIEELIDEDIDYES
jgi:hypothetical protein